MNTLIEQFRKELGDLALYADDTIANYIACLYKFVAFLQTEFNIEPLNVKPKRPFTSMSPKNSNNKHLNPSPLRRLSPGPICMVEHPDCYVKLKGAMLWTIYQPFPKNIS